MRTDRTWNHQWSISGLPFRHALDRPFYDGSSGLNLSPFSGRSITVRIFVAAEDLPRSFVAGNSSL